jgi:HAD superfamily hydrolase (TIGR01509 family)
MIKAIIFDLNGIFIDAPKLSKRFKDDFNVPVPEFLIELSKIMEEVRRPNAGGAFKFWQPVLQKWNVKFSEQEFWDYWFKQEIVSEDMVSFTRDLRKKGLKIFLLSNNFKERSEYYGHYPWLGEIIDKAYFSWQTGFVKPDKMAWKKILDENSLKPSECLFFDDQSKNIEVAESLGIKSFIFNGVEDVKDIISKNL